MEITRLDLDPLGRLPGYNSGPQAKIGDIDISRSVPYRLLGRIAVIGPPAMLDRISAADGEREAIVPPGNTAQQV